MQTNTDKTILYLIQAENTHLVKIGITTDLQHRIKSIQTGCPYKLAVIATWPGSRTLESNLHKRLAEHRQSGEWFLLPESAPDRLAALIQAHITQYQIDSMLCAQHPKRRWIISTMADVYLLDLSDALQRATEEGLIQPIETEAGMMYQLPICRNHLMVSLPICPMCIE